MDSKMPISKHNKQYAKFSMIKQQILPSLGKLNLQSNKAQQEYYSARFLEQIHAKTQKQIQSLDTANLGANLRFRKQLHSRKLSTKNQQDKFKSDEFQRQIYFQKQSNYSNTNKFRSTFSNCISKQYTTPNYYNSYSPLKSARNSEQITKTYFHDNIARRNIKAEIMAKKQKQKKSHHIQSSKQLFSSIISGWAVFSQLGKAANQNNCRVYINPNLVRKDDPHKNISFFGIYQGISNTQKIEYLRLKFPLKLVNNECIYSNFLQAFTRVVEEANKQIEMNPILKGDSSNTQAIFCVIVGLKIYLIRTGYSNCSVCFNFGEEIRSLQVKIRKSNIVNKQVRSYSLSQLIVSHKNSEYNLFGERNRRCLWPNIDIKQFDYSEKIDFIFLANEGIYQNIGEPAKKIWRQIIRKQKQLSFSDNISNSVKKVCLKAIEKDMRGRSMTSILIAFENIRKVINKSQQKIQLPYIHPPHKFHQLNADKTNDYQT